VIHALQYRLLDLFALKHYLFKAEARLNNTEEFSPYVKENTILHHYKDQLDNGV
jgi:hypothetical protein